MTQLFRCLHPCASNMSVRLQIPSFVPPRKTGFELEVSFLQALSYAFALTFITKGTYHVSECVLRSTYFGLT